MSRMSGVCHRFEASGQRASHLKTYKPLGQRPE